MTNTKNTTKNTTQNTTTDDDVAVSKILEDAKFLFDYYGLSDKDIRTIVEVSNYDIDKCKKAKAVLDQQGKQIHNITGWLIKAITNDYTPVKKSPAKQASEFNNFTQRQYDYDALEQQMLKKSMPHPEQK